MKILDYFFSKMYKFFGQEHFISSDGRACILMSIIMLSLVDAILCTIGIFYDNVISALIIQYKFATITPGIIFCVLVSIRYSSIGIDDIKKMHDVIDKKKRIILDVFFYVMLIIIPVWFFISFRVYLLGRI
ncbi:MAG: hypothetical protein LBT56_08450 [Prevotellaceae bacterium]|jgi:hypothetical protein|nr:hypothetical protein [Prevotellaceae bacterium]